jgi:3-oxoacyl-[acyl-carrier protein] reductase
VITGVGRAGQAAEVVAHAFAARGAAVECLGRGPEVHSRVAELSRSGFRVAGHEVDLTDADATSSVADAVAARHDGRIAAVIALAGGFVPSGPLAESEPSVLQNNLAINVVTAYVTARAFLPSVRRARGAFVFTASAAVLPGGRTAGLSGYAIAKGGLIQLVRSLAQEERPNGIRANALAPTSIRTAANVAAMGSDYQYVEREELAAMVLLLCSPAFGRVTGQVIELA